MATTKVGTSGNDSISNDKSEMIIQALGGNDTVDNKADNV